MPSIILVGTVQVNTPQQNSGVFVGQYNLAGWDANRKMSQTHGGMWGFFNFVPGQFNFNSDCFEFIDGAIIDTDMKPIISANL